MNKDIHKYISNCALCKREKAQTLVDNPFDKIAKDLVLDLKSPHQEINIY